MMGDWRATQLSTTTVLDRHGKVVSVGQPKQRKQKDPAALATSLASASASASALGPHGAGNANQFVVVPKTKAKKGRAKHPSDAAPPMPASSWALAQEFVPSQQSAAMAPWIPPMLQQPTPGSRYANVARSALEGTEALEAAPLCPQGVATGDCYDDDCPYLHGIECPVCELLVLHPFRPEEHDAHVEACAQEQENKEKVCLCMRLCVCLCVHVCVFVCLCVCVCVCVWLRMGLDSPSNSLLPLVLSCRDAK